MVPWLVALVAGVVAVTVLQVAVYYYLLEGQTATGGDDDPGGPDPTPTGRPEAEGRTGRTRACPECGAPNAADGVYTFCRDCGAGLS